MGITIEFEHIVMGILILAVLLCGFYPYGFTALVQQNETSEVCEMCCNLNQKLFEITNGFVDDKCIITEDGSDGDGSAPVEEEIVPSGISCSSVWNPSESTCASAYCTEANSRCVYVPDTLMVADHCTCRTCVDSDGGINFAVQGYCEDSYHMAGFPDEINTDWYCDANNICVETRAV